MVVTSAAAAEADAGFVSAAAELGADDADAGGPRPLAGAPVKGQALAIPAGTFRAGSTPGEPGREAAVEPALLEVELGSFKIDALPYPNDPVLPPVMVDSPEEAARLCGEQGARLCTELEWERACKGPDGDRYATGPVWDSACERSPSRCASGFDVRAQGFMPEWTDSRFEDRSEVPVVRGGPDAARRCAARIRGTAKTTPARMAFRCCHGARNDAAVPKIEAKTAFRKTSLEAADLERIFAASPELSRIAEGVRLFSDDEAKTIVSRSSASADGIHFATSPILWSPEPGVELLVATGRARKTAFVVALWVLPNDTYRFASSFLLLGDSAPVALAYEPSRRKELRWSACWHCAGEQGAVSVRDDGRVVIVQY